MPTVTTDEADVVVVGGGLAGLCAARDLQAAGRSVIVLEARDRVGGRTLNHDLGGGKVVEVGGQWVGPTQDRVLALADSLGVDTHPTFDTGRKVLCVGDRRIVYGGLVPRIDPVGLADVGRATAALGWLARKVPLEAPWKAKGAKAIDSLTVSTWAKRNVFTNIGRMTVELVVQNMLACEPHEVSLLHFLFLVKSAGGFRRMGGVVGGAQQDRFIGGSQILSDRLADRLVPGTVRLCCPARRIEHGPDRVVVYSDEVRVTARDAVIAVPPMLAGRIAYDPLLPGWRDQLTQRAPMGSVIKCLAIYDEPFWRADRYSGQAAGDGGVVRATFDNCPPDANPGILLGFVEGARARMVSRADPSERRQAVLDSFVRYFGDKAAKPVDYLEQDWTSEEWTRGCYGAYFGPGVWTEFGPALRQPIGRLHWAGAETAIQWAGYMDGAVSSGERAAAEILAEQRPAPVPSLSEISG